ncbi:DUF6415 family natural product biosynthesis protein [Streptomyces sp. NPDC017993]|uniref:DUF6415 family natural product biosynthesis protein n=1 Tax=Streptomyces sp. NPDC017993 TaxID=3365027 RepID=UPI0037A10E7E
MTATTAPPPADPDLSIVRLHGEACYWCGAAHGALAPAGSVTTPVEGGVCVWFIVACPQHRDPEAAVNTRAEGSTERFAPALRIDAETISETIHRALQFGLGRPELSEMTELEEELHGHIALLLAEARKPDRMQWQGSVEAPSLTGRLDCIERQARQGLGRGALAAHVQVHQLARDCQWLLAWLTAEVGR